MASKDKTRAEALAELQAWYLGSLAPKLARAANAGTVDRIDAAACDTDVRRLLELRDRVEAEAA